MTDKPLEQILEEFRQQIKEENKYSRRLARYAQSSFKFIKNSAKDLGSFVKFYSKDVGYLVKDTCKDSASFIKNHYEDGTLETLGKAGLVVGSLGLFAGICSTVGYKDIMYKTINDYILAGAVGAGLGAISGTVLMIQESSCENLKEPVKKPFSYYLLSSAALATAGAAGGMLLNALLGHPPNHPEDGPFLAGGFAGAVCVLTTVVRIAWYSQENQK